MTIMQGDQYSLQFDFINNDEQPISREDISDVEIMIGYIRKTLSDGDILYHEGERTFLFPLSQADTFSMNPGTYKVQTRLKSIDGLVVGNEDAGTLIVSAARSKEIL